VQKGFSFPDTLEEWLQPEWESFDLRRGRITPWLSLKTVRHIGNFETVLTAAFPSLSNFQISRFGKFVLMFIGRIRYYIRWYCLPYELKLLLKLFSYLRPGKEGFYSE
jgi:hypothetical protein